MDVFSDAKMQARAVHFRATCGYILPQTLISGCALDTITLTRLEILLLFLTRRALPCVCVPICRRGWRRHVADIFLSVGGIEVTHSGMACVYAFAHACGMGPTHS